MVSEQSCVRSPLRSVVEGGSNWFDHCYANPDRVDTEPHQFDHEDDIIGDDVDFDELRHLLSDDFMESVLVSSSSSSHEDDSQSQVYNNGGKRRKTEQTSGAQGSQALTCNISEGRAVETPSHQVVSSMPQTSSSFQQ